MNDGRHLGLKLFFIFPLCFLMFGMQALSKRFRLAERLAKKLRIKNQTAEKWIEGIIMTVSFIAVLTAYLCILKFTEYDIFEGEYMD